MFQQYKVIHFPISGSFSYIGMAIIELAVRKRDTAHVHLCVQQRREATQDITSVVKSVFICTSFTSFHHGLYIWNRMPSSQNALISQQARMFLLAV